MKIYCTSDTHFNHKKLVEYGRPHNFEEKMLSSLSCTNGDILIHCGDFCIGNDEQSIKDFMRACSKFKKVILVKGNHDKKSNSWYIEHGFDFICDSFTLNSYGKRIIFTHIPVENDGKFDLNIHGHLHGNSHREVEGYDANFHFDLAPEVHNYKPVELQKICNQ